MNCRPRPSYRRGVTPIAASRWRIEPNAASFRPGGTVEVGSFFDGWQFTTRLTPTWNVSKYLELAGAYQFTRIGFPDRDQEHRANVLGLRAIGAMNTRLSASAFVQYNHAADAFTGNLRVRYNPGEGNDLYLVYNLGANTDRFAYHPERPAIESQVLLIKYSRAFDLAF